MPKYDGDFGAPNVFVHLDEHLCQLKIENLSREFPHSGTGAGSRGSCSWRFLRLRGMEPKGAERIRGSLLRAKTGAGMRTGPAVTRMVGG